MKLTIGNSVRKKSMLVGNEEFPKILASIGASNTSDSLDIEINKAQIAKKYGADYHRPYLTPYLQRDT